MGNKKVFLSFLSNRVEKESGTMDADVVIWIPFITAAITLLFNSIFHGLKNRLDWFQDKKKFERDHSYNQLRELYFPLYGIIAQSEFLRYIYKFDEQFSILELPFLEIKRTVRKDIRRSNGEREISISKEETDITKFNKKNLVNLILEKQEFASQKLLKLAIGYRYSHEKYLIPSLSEEQKEKYQINELMLIYEIVTTVIKETNEKLELCNMQFTKTELETGIMDYNVFTTAEEYNSLKND